MPGFEVYPGSSWVCEGGRVYELDISKVREVYVGGIERDEAATTAMVGEYQSRRRN